MMSAPSCARRTACERPWPRAAPVMNATLPSSLAIGLLPSEHWPLTTRMVSVAADKILGGSGRAVSGRVAGKVIAITGAASGLGEATARLMAAEGARVVLADIQDERGTALAEELGGGARYVHCDVTSEAGVAAVV